MIIHAISRPIGAEARTGNKGPTIINVPRIKVLAPTKVTLQRSLAASYTRWVVPTAGQTVGVITRCLFFSLALCLQ